MSENQKQILKVSKDSLLAVISSIIPVSETVTFFFRKLKETDTKKTLLVDEYGQSKTLKIKGIYKDITTEEDSNSYRFNILKLYEWLKIISGDILILTDSSNNIIFALTGLTGDIEKEHTETLLQEVEREPNIPPIDFPIHFKVKYQDLDSAKNELTSVGETLEFDVGGTIRLSCSSAGSKTKTTLTVSEKFVEQSQYDKYMYDYTLFVKSLKGLESFSEVKVNFGKIDGKFLPLILEASNETTELKYGITPKTAK